MVITAARRVERSQRKAVKRVQMKYGSFVGRVSRWYFSASSTRMSVENSPVVAHHSLALLNIHRFSFLLASLRDSSFPLLSLSLYFLSFCSEQRQSYKTNAVRQEIKRSARQTKSKEEETPTVPFSASVASTGTGIRKIGIPTGYTNDFCLLTVSPLQL